MFQRTYSCLTEKKELRIVYLGGSITEGAGASHSGRCYASLLTDWFQAAWPGCAVKGFNAAIGGTTSVLGAFRMENDVLCHKPDLVFVEFAVNDNGTAIQYGEAMEGILQKIRAFDPETDVVVVLTTTKTMAETNPGGLAESTRIHQEVAAHYQVPFVHVGLALVREMKAQGFDYSDYLPDGVHPNDRGYRHYFRTLRDYLQTELADGADRPPHIWPEAPLHAATYGNAWMMPAVTAQYAGFQPEYISMCRRYPSYLSSNHPGSRITVDFSGTAFGLFWMIAADGGILRWRCDGGEWQTRSAWDSYALNFDRARGDMLLEHLFPGPHRVEIEVTSQKAPQSKGTFIRIGAFLINP